MVLVCVRRWIGIRGLLDFNDMVELMLRQHCFAADEDLCGRNVLQLTPCHCYEYSSEYHRNTFLGFINPYSVLWSYVCLGL